MYKTTYKVNKTKRRLVKHKRVKENIIVCYNRYGKSPVSNLCLLTDVISLRITDMYSS